MGICITVNNSNHSLEEVIAARYLAAESGFAGGIDDAGRLGPWRPPRMYSSSTIRGFELLSGAGILTFRLRITWFKGGNAGGRSGPQPVHRDDLDSVRPPDVQGQRAN